MCSQSDLGVCPPVKFGIWQNRAKKGGKSRAKMTNENISRSKNDFLFLMNVSETPSRDLFKNALKFINLNRDDLFFLFYKFFLNFFLA